TASLRLTFTSLNRAAGGSRNALLTLRAGLTAHRLGELGADPDFGDAVKLLRKTIALEASWPYAWYTLGLAEAEHAKWQQADRLALGNRVGVESLERASDCYRHALLADSSFTRAAVALSDLVLSLHDTAMYAGARDALRRASVAQRSPEVLVAWGRMER